MDLNDLTPQEIERLKRLLSMSRSKVDRLEKIADEDEKWEWVWANIRKFGTTVFFFVTALVAVRDDLAKLLFGDGKGP